MKNPLFLNVFCGIYDQSLFISLRAFLPSLRVVKVSQDRAEMIRMISIIKEMKVVSILLTNFLQFF